MHTTFHEPFVLFGYLAACTGLEFVTGVIILPQRQTTLVAKQAADFDRGKALDEVVRLALDPGEHGGADPAVVDGVGEVVTPAGRPEVEEHLDVVQVGGRGPIRLVADHQQP